MVDAPGLSFSLSFYSAAVAITAVTAAAATAANHTKGLREMKLAALALFYFCDCCSFACKSAAASWSGQDVCLNPHLIPLQR